MIPVNAQLSALLASSTRAPRVYMDVQLPVYTNINTNQINPQQLGSKIILDDAVSLRHSTTNSTASDIATIQFINHKGLYSPLDKLSKFGRYFGTGLADVKYQLYIGVVLDGAETLVPKGVFLNNATSLNVANGDESTITLNCIDQFNLFNGHVYAQFPPKLYGNQASSYYNPNYALKPINTSGNTATKWQCDAQNWMNLASDNAVFASDFVAPAVYVGTVGSPATTATAPTAYTLDLINGIVTFTTAISTSSVVSVDARPLAMAPELMLQHLFVDFGAFDPNFLKFDATGLKLPVMENARDRPIIQVAQEIVLTTSTRGIPWEMYFDENGFIVFSEGRYDIPVVKTFVDSKDILEWAPEPSASNIYNVVRAQAKASNDQPLTSVAYDVRSINDFTQRATYDIPAQLLATVVGMDPGAGMALLNGFTSSVLFQNSTPTVTATMKALPDPTLQIGDAIGVIEENTGTNSTYYITQIDNTIQEDNWQQTYTVNKQKRTQDFQFGLAAYAGTPSPQAANNIQTMGGLIQQVSFNGSTVVQGGQPVILSDYEPFVPTWNAGTSLPISITLNNTNPAGTAYIWRFMYLCEDVYIQSGSSNVLATGLMSGATMSHPPFEVKNNADSSRARRAYWPLLRSSDWLAGDGVTSYSTASTNTLSSTYTGGVVVTNPQVYGNLIYPKTDYFADTTAGFKGQSIWAAGTPFATAIGASSNVKFGVDFGVTQSFTCAYGIKRPVTPGFLVIVVANTLGVIQTKKIPFDYLNTY